MFLEANNQALGKTR